MYLGKRPGFGQSFRPPQPSPYLDFLLPLSENWERSPVSLKLIRDDIKAAEINVQLTRPKDSILDEAIRRAFRAFQLPVAQPLIHLNDVFKLDLPIWSSSPGLPWTQLGYKKKSEIRDDVDAVKRVRWFWHRVKQFQDISLPDCCAYVRSHLTDGEPKIRAVWGYPATVTFGEAVFAIPLIEAYQKGGYPIAYGWEAGVGGVKRLFRSFKGKHFLGVDFKKFDKTLPAWLISVAFDILAMNLDFSKYREYGVTRVTSMLHMYDVIRDYCINTKIRMCNGERYKKRSGLASGSYFTQLVGSIANYILLQYACLKSDIRIEQILVFGDDSLIGVDRSLCVSSIAEALEPLGMVVNVSKSGSSSAIGHLTFLGYRINSGLPGKDRSKQFAALLWPERPDKAWDDVASRALGILYANFGVDPVVDFWCREVVAFRPFDIMLSRNQQRYMDLIGIKIKDTAPTMEDFARRLGY